MIYLAQPYSHPDAEVREKRYEAALHVCSLMAQTDMVVYSPIAHWHPVAKAHHLPPGAEFWEEQNEVMLGFAQGLYMLGLDGWKTSSGLYQELTWADDWGIDTSRLTFSGTTLERYLTTPQALLAEMTIAEDNQQQGPGRGDVEGDVEG